MNITLTLTEAGIICFLIVMVIWILIDTLKERNREKRCLEMNINSWEKACEWKNEDIRKLQKCRETLTTECTDLHAKLDAIPLPTLYCLVDTSKIRSTRSAVYRWYKAHGFVDAGLGVWKRKLDNIGYHITIRDHVLKHAVNHGYSVTVLDGMNEETAIGQVRTYDYPDTEATC